MGAENLFQEIIAEKFPNLGKETNIQVQSALRVSNNMNQQRSTQRHIIIIKMTKIKEKEKILKVGREPVTCKGNPVSLSADF